MKVVAEMPADLEYVVLEKVHATNTSFLCDEWPGAAHQDDYLLGKQWFSDVPDCSLYEGKWQGAKTTRRWRQEALVDWARRWGWLK